MDETPETSREKDRERQAETVKYRCREYEPVTIDLDKWTPLVDVTIFEAIEVKSAKDFYLKKKSNDGKRKRKHAVSAPIGKPKKMKENIRRISRSPDEVLKQKKVKTPAFIMDSDGSDTESQTAKKLKEENQAGKEGHLKRTQNETKRERKEKERQEELEKEERRKERKREKEKAKKNVPKDDDYSNPATPMVIPEAEEVDDEALRIRREEDALIEKHRAGIELEKEKELKEKRLLEFEYSLQEAHWSFYDAAGLSDDYLRNAFDLKKVKEDKEMAGPSFEQPKSLDKDDNENEKKQKRVQKEKEHAKRRRAAIDEQPCMQCSKIKPDSRFEDFGGTPSQFCSHECIRTIVKKAKSVLVDESAEVMLMSNGCVHAGVRVSGLLDYLMKNPHVAPVLPAMRKDSNPNNVRAQADEVNSGRSPDQLRIDRSDQVDKLQKHLKEQAEKKKLEKETENMRANCKKTMIEQLLKRVKRPLDYGVTTKCIKELVENIEKTLFGACNNDVKGKYKAWVKGFIEQVMSVKNKGFFFRVVKGMIGVSLLVSLKPEDFTDSAYAAEVDPPEEKNVPTQSTLKQQTKGSIIDDLFDSERDTTLEHGSHMYDRRCRICQERTKIELERVAKEREEAQQARIDEQERRKKKEQLRQNHKPRQVQPTFGYAREIQKADNDFDFSKPLGGFCPKTPLYGFSSDKESRARLRHDEKEPPTRFGSLCSPSEVFKTAMCQLSWKKSGEFSVGRENFNNQGPSSKKFWALVDEEMYATPGTERLRPLKPRLTEEPESSADDDESHEPVIPASFYDMIKKQQEEQKVLNVKTMPINNIEDVTKALHHDWKANEVLLIAKRFISLGRPKEETEIVHKLCLNYIQNKIKAIDKAKNDVEPVIKQKPIEEEPQSEAKKETSQDKHHEKAWTSEATESETVVKFGLHNIETSNATFTAGGGTLSIMPTVTEEMSSTLEGPLTAPPLPPMLVNSGPGSGKMVMNEGKIREIADEINDMYRVTNERALQLREHFNRLQKLLTEDALIHKSITENKEVLDRYTFVLLSENLPTEVAKMLQTELKITNPVIDDRMGQSSSKRETSCVKNW